MLINFQQIFSTYHQYLYRSIWFISAWQLIFTTSSAQANCVDRIAKLELVQPSMERLWQELQHKDQYPWGKKRPYGQLTGNKITLTADFDSLTGAQKKETLRMLHLSYSQNWFDLLTPEEQQTALKNPNMGAMSPYVVYGSDDRLISAPYDGCTRMTLLTEKARFSWYYLRISHQNDDQIMLRNVGNPPWRQVKFPISAEEEKSVRYLFWRIIGFDNSNPGWWIAWVPEKGYFEINVPRNYNQKLLQKFQKLVPVQYRYVIVADDGTLLEKIN